MRRRHKHWTPSVPLTEPSLFELPPAFRGATFDVAQDQSRLETALAKVKRCLESGKAWTLAELAHEAGCSESGASARLRDCRRMFSMRIQAERVIGARGLWRYSLIR